jgi:7,8-dihydropterin-6-yl-methyl-4-(beta-D-ribofuranosyl)aminobenzene 5'-phosphate synthase
VAEFNPTPSNRRIEGRQRGDLEIVATRWTELRRNHVSVCGFCDHRKRVVVARGKAVGWVSYIQVIDKTTEVTPGITLIALISDAPGTKELKELSLAINTPDGVVLAVACAHPGIEAIVAEAAKINPHIHLIAGGFHLVVAPDPAIQKVASALHDTYKVDYVAPGHCTGEPTFAALQKAFGDWYLYAGLGTTLRVGANPRPEPDRRVSNILGEGDLRSYRTLLAQSDDFKGRSSEAVRLAQAQ